MAIMTDCGLVQPIHTIENQLCLTIISVQKATMMIIDICEREYNERNAENPAISVFI
jgi:hypothetical protein